MRLLLVGDLHYEMRQLDWVLAHASGYDLVVIAGDLLDISSVVPLEAQVATTLAYLERLAGRAPVIVSSGNHDLTGRDGNGEKAALWLDDVRGFGVVTDYGSMELGGAHITVCPWWDGPKGRARVEELLTSEAVLAAGAARWIWIYHWPPPELPVSWTGRQSYGDADLAGWIERFAPALVLTGHVHQAPLADGGSWLSRTGDTWVINGGHQIGEVPSHVVVDLDAWSASWWSIEATDDRSLVVPQPA